MIICLAINEFHLTTFLFDQTKEVLMNHIDESEIVTVKLVDTIDKVKKIHLYRSVSNIHLRA